MYHGLAMPKLTIAALSLLLFACEPGERCLEVKVQGSPTADRTAVVCSEPNCWGYARIAMQNGAYSVELLDRPDLHPDQCSQRGLTSPTE